MKKMKIFAILLVFVALFTACASSPAAVEDKPAADTTADAVDATEDAALAENADERIEVKVCYAVEIMDDNQTDIWNHTMHQFELLNESQDKYFFTGFTAFDANGDADKMNADIETAVVNGYKVIITMPVDAAATTSVYEYCWDNDVIVIDMRAISYTDKVACLYAGYNDELIAIARYEWVKQYIADHPDEKIYMGLVYPDPGSTGSFIRLDMMKQLAEEYPENLEIVAEGYGNWATDDSQILVEDWIQAHPEMNMITAANDESALGCINALEAAGIKDQVIVTGVNASAFGVGLIKEGKLDLSVGVKKDVVCGTMAQIAYNLLEGDETGIDPVTRQYDVSQLKMAQLVDASNVVEWEEYLSQFNW